MSHNSDVAVAVNGCRRCGREQRTHALEWDDAVGYHHWVAPTDEQRVERIHTRREAGNSPR